MRALIVATYNESLNAPRLIEEIREYQPDLQIIVVDDNSPDNTAGILNDLGDGNLRVIVRKKEKGYGTAVCRGLREALKMGATKVATMDADFSHEPKELSHMFEALEVADVAIGSRYVDGVRVINWKIKRLLLSLFANFYVRTILGLKVNDCTSGYRAYRREILKEMNLKKIDSNGYSFLVEMLWKAKRRKGKIKEVPIVFVERREGESKMDGSVIWESVWMPFRLRLFK